MLFFSLTYQYCNIKISYECVKFNMTHKKTEYVIEVDLRHLSKNLSNMPVEININPNPYPTYGYKTFLFFKNETLTEMLSKIFSKTV